MGTSHFGAGRSFQGWRPSDFINDFGRAGRLLVDGRVPLGLKLLLPLGALVYWLVPIDLMPFLPFDDIAILLLAVRLFTLLGDNALNRTLTRGGSSTEDSPFAPRDSHAAQVVDTTWHVVDE